MYTPSNTRYDQMQYRRCGNSGLLLPAISLGLWHNFGSVDCLDNCTNIIRKAFDAGITYFDLANNYGPEPGSAEENFGRILKENLSHHRDELIISTKAGYRMWEGPYGEWGSRKSLLASLDQSLKRLQLDYVDIFYSHRFDPDTPLLETMTALADAVKAGKSLYVGISNYPADKTREAQTILKQLGVPAIVHQPRYSMLDRWVEAELMDTLQTEGMGCVAFSPLAQGLLTNKYLHEIPKNSRAAKSTGALDAKNITPQLLEKLNALNDMAELRGQSLAQMAISWLLKDHRLTSVIIGASSVAQLEDNLQALQNSAFDAEDIATIDEILK